jgi:thiol-disulfide isomerase/thioredoxin
MTETTANPDVERTPTSLMTRLKRVRLALLLAPVLVAVVVAACSSAVTGNEQGATDLQAVVVKPVSPAAEPEPEAETPAVGALQQMPVVDFVWFDGTPGSTADLVGQPTVLNFWASNCPPCVAEMPAFEQVHQSLTKSVAFVGIAVADSAEAARALAAQTGVTYRLGDDPDSEVFRSFGGFVLPTTVLLNRQGEVAYVWAGALTGDELRILIDEHIEPGSL